MWKKEGYCVIAIAGDSGDGIQAAGQKLSYACARSFFYVQTVADFPAEIRAPVGTRGGVSGSYLVFSSKPVSHVPEYADVLVALNPAALSVVMPRVRSHSIILFDSDQWTSRHLNKAQLNVDPLEQLDAKSIAIPMTKLVTELARVHNLPLQKAKKNRNMIAIGAVMWIYGIPFTYGEEWLRQKFGPESALPCLALKVGYDFAETVECPQYQKNHQDIPFQLNESSNQYAQLSGNEATILGLVAAIQRHGRRAVLCGYPITPASDLLQYGRKFSQMGLNVIQAEDEIAAAGIALGVSYSGAIGVCCTSGPGFDLKSEMIGLAVMAELPLVVIDVQRAGPSTGMPTKTEQSDLLTALYGRHGESPVPVFAIPTVQQAQKIVCDAVDFAIQAMTPVIILSDASLANTSCPVPYQPVEPLIQKDENWVSRRKSNGVPHWITPGTPEREFCLGGLEKDEVTGEVSHDPQNHEKMVRLRRQKIEQFAQVLDWRFSEDRELLWISYGSVSGSVDYYRQLHTHFAGDHLVLTQIWPLPENFWEIVSQYKNCFVVELADQQFLRYLRSFGKPVVFHGHGQVTGQTLDCVRLHTWVQERQK